MPILRPKGHAVGGNLRSRGSASHRRPDTMGQHRYLVPRVQSTEGRADSGGGGHAAAKGTDATEVAADHDVFSASATRAVDLEAVPVRLSVLERKPRRKLTGPATFIAGPVPQPRCVDILTLGRTLPSEGRVARPVDRWDDDQMMFCEYKVYIGDGMPSPQFDTLPLNQADSPILSAQSNAETSDVDPSKLERYGRPNLIACRRRPN